MLKKDLATLTFESKVRCYGPALPSIDPADIVSRPVDSPPSTKEYTPRISFMISNFELECKNDAVLCLPPFILTVEATGYVSGGVLQWIQRSKRKLFDGPCQCAKGQV